MWLYPSWLQTIKNIILITLYLYGKRKKEKQSTGAVLRDLYAIPLSSFCPSFLTMSAFHG